MQFVLSVTMRPRLNNSAGNGIQSWVQLKQENFSYRCKQTVLQYSSRSNSMSIGSTRACPEFFTGGQDQRPPPHHLWGFRPRPSKRVSTIFSTQDGLSWQYNIVSHAAIRRQDLPCPPCIRPWCSIVTKNFDPLKPITGVDGRIGSCIGSCKKLPFLHLVVHHAMLCYKCNLVFNIQTAEHGLDLIRTAFTIHSDMYSIKQLEEIIFSPFILIKISKNLYSHLFSCSVTCFKFLQCNSKMLYVITWYVVVMSYCAQW